MDSKRNAIAIVGVLVGVLFLSDAARAQTVGPCKMIVKADQIEFEGCNVFVNDGQPDEDTGGPPNGRGNLIVGFDDAAISGSHNIAVGEGHTFSSYGGLVAGYANTISDAFASVTGGLYNTASYSYSSVSGGAYNTASGYAATALGGNGTVASDAFDVVP